MILDSDLNLEYKDLDSGMSDLKFCKVEILQFECKRLALGLVDTASSTRLPRCPAGQITVE